MTRGDGSSGAEVVDQPQYRPAGIVTRLAAAAVDFGAVLALTGGLYLASTAAVFLWSPVAFRWWTPEPSVTAWSALGVAVVYLAAGWQSAGRTWGAALLGLRVTTRNPKSRLGAPRAFARAVLCVVFPVGLLWVAVSPGRRSAQDLLVGTLVVYDWRR